MVRLRSMRRTLILLALALSAVALLAAGCGGEEVSATPETVVGEIPTTAETNGSADLPALALERRCGRGRVHLREQRLRRMPRAGGGRRERDGRPEPRRGEAVVRALGHAHHEGPGRHALVRGPARAAGDRRRGAVRRRLVERLILPSNFPSEVQAFACDLDRTLIGPGGTLSERTLRAIARSRASGRPFLVATGRMFRSVRPYLVQAGIAEPAICYQGAAVVDPASGEFLLHETLELAAARDALAVLREHGHFPNVYVDDDLYVRSHTEQSRRYAEFQGLPVTEVGDLEEWLERPPTKLVVVLEPERVPALRATLAAALGSRVFLTTSLPYFLELGSPTVSKGSGLRFVAERLGLDTKHMVSFGDGENDVELIEDVGFGIAVEGSHPRLLDVADWVCSGPEEDGVAAVIEAYLDSVA